MDSSNLNEEFVEYFDNLLKEGLRQQKSFPDEMQGTIKSELKKMVQEAREFYRNKKDVGVSQLPTTKAVGLP